MNKIASKLYNMSKNFKIHWHEKSKIFIYSLHSNHRSTTQAKKIKILSLVTSQSSSKIKNSRYVIPRVFILSKQLN